MRASLFRKGDLVILAAVLLAVLLASLPFLGRKGASVAYVRYRDTLLDTVSLGETEERVYRLDAGEVTVRFSKSGVAVLSSPCHGQDCVRTGTVHAEGSGVFCLPLGFSVVLSGEGAFDAVTG